MPEMGIFLDPEDPPPGSSVDSQLPEGASRGPSAAGSVSSSDNARFTPSVSAACLACRGKHLKCDGKRPCTRCTNLNCECIYVASRRGYRGPSRSGVVKNNKKRLVSAALAPTAVSSVGSAASVPSSLVSAFNPSLAYSSEDPLAQLLFQTTTPIPSNNFGFSLDSSFGYGLDAFSYSFGDYGRQLSTPRDQYLDSYYANFYPAHPFVLPRDQLPLVSKDGALDPLMAAMRWVGSLFVSGSPRIGLFDEAYRLVYDHTYPQDGFLVQAMMVLIIGLDGNRKRDKVHELLSRVEHVAVQIGLHTRLYATYHGRGMPVLEESWRRTWWDLYITDAMMAGVHRTSHFLLYDIQADVGLPCEEYQYTSGHIPPTRYIEDFDNRQFSDDTTEFSSFAYGIQCARHIGKFMRLPPIFGPKDKNIARIEALLTNWQLDLPASKRDALYQDGQPDEIMFQALMMVNAISILLHQPFSQLDPSPTHYINACAPNTPALSSESFNMHTKRTIHAANEISKLITHRVPLIEHTHFFAYMVTLSSTIHLSLWSLPFMSHNDDTLRQKIRLNIGALEKFSEIWPAAGHLSAQVRGIAKEIYRAKKQQEIASQTWLGAMQEEMINNIVTTQSMITATDQITWDPQSVANTNIDVTFRPKGDAQPQLYISED